MRAHSPIAWRALLLGLALTSATRAQSAASPMTWKITVDSEIPLDIGRIYNAPNGHISYQRDKDSLTLWVDGRLAPARVQGTFRLRSPNWGNVSLTAAKPESVFAATHTKDPCTAPSAWNRNYAAINAIIPGSRPHQLLAFVDGEFHPDSTGTPLHASIGLATSTDGEHWDNRQLLIQGNNMVAANFDCAHVNALMKKQTDNVGAAGPSAIIRMDGNTRYIYVYYLDRVLADATVSPPLAASANIYVARAKYTDDGTAGNWEFWNGKRWTVGSSEGIASPVVYAPAGSVEAAQPQVTYNTALKRWLMVFHTRLDLYATSSADGITWDPPQPLGARTGTNRAPAFPTLVDTSSNDQLTTGAKGLLFYSREVDGPGKRKSYPGFVRSYTIVTTVERKSRKR